MKDKKIAIFEIGGKQYLAQKDEIITVSNFDEDIEIGKDYETDKVLLTYEPNDKKTELGSPYIAKGKVKFTVEDRGKGKKVSVIKYKSKSRYFRNKGHRQPYTKLKVISF